MARLDGIISALGQENDRQEAARGLLELRGQLQELQMREAELEKLVGVLSVLSPLLFFSQQC